MGGIPSILRNSQQLLPTRPSITKSSLRPVISQRGDALISGAHSELSYKISPLFLSWWPHIIIPKCLCTQGAPTSAILSTFSYSNSKSGEMNDVTQMKKKKIEKDRPEWQLKFGLDMCSKYGDVVEALNLYDKAVTEGTQPNQHHYNVLLYLCASAAMGVLRPADRAKDQNLANLEEFIEEDGAKISDEIRYLALRRGFEIYIQMGIDKIPPNVATFTAVARLAAAKEDGVLAFDLVKKMSEWNIPPKLRSYGPALFAFCKSRDAERAYEVDAHMILSGVQPEEPELGALLKLSVDVFREERVYSLLHRLRTTVRHVSQSTSEVIEQWFKGQGAGKLGQVVWDHKKIREAVVAGGGGWHGQGWLGTGDWRVKRTTMNPNGVCPCCQERLVTIDIDPLETENFARSVAALACERELQSKFVSFQEWLDEHGPFEVVVDGANTGLFQQIKNAFSFSQINAVANGLKQKSPSKKMPLIILHNRRTRGGPADWPGNKQLIENWRKAGALYTTPTGSNDDWYWLYAAVRLKCLVLTADKMRDHIFELLGNSFFSKWKERHQVRFTMTRSGPEFHMPPPYSDIIQESEVGSWHIPTVCGDDIETPRIWLCITRPKQVELEKCSIPASYERKVQSDSPLSALKNTNGEAIYVANLHMKEKDRPRFACRNRMPSNLDFSGTEEMKIRSRENSPSSTSSQAFQSRNTWKERTLSSCPPSSSSSPKGRKIRILEMHVDSPVDKRTN